MYLLPPLTRVDTFGGCQGSVTQDGEAIKLIGRRVLLRCQNVRLFPYYGPSWFFPKGSTPQGGSPRVFQPWVHSLVCTEACKVFPPSVGAETCMTFLFPPKILVGRTGFTFLASPRGISLIASNSDTNDRRFPLRCGTLLSSSPFPDKSVHFARPPGPRTALSLKGLASK